MGVVIDWLELGAACKRIRKQRGWSADLVAAKAGCHRTTVYRLERCEPIRMESLQLILVALGVELRVDARMSVLSDVAPN